MNVYLQNNLQIYFTKLWIQIKEWKDKGVLLVVVFTEPCVEIFEICKKERHLNTKQFKNCKQNLYMHLIKWHQTLGDNLRHM